MAITKRQMERTLRRLLNLKDKINQVNEDLEAMDVSELDDKSIRPAIRNVEAKIKLIEMRGA